MILKRGKIRKCVDLIVTFVLILVLSFLILELISFILVTTVNLVSRGTYDSILNREVLKDKSWTAEYIKETKEMEQEFYPFIGYRSKGNFNRTYIHLDNNSIRYTDNPCKGKDAIKLFTFGGSTMQGYGARDNYTIPSFISRNLCNEGIKIEISNFGDTGQTNTQEMIRLILEIRKGNIPDYVVFYDGVNDVYSAYQNDEAGLQQNILNRQIEFNSKRKFNIITPILWNTYTGQICRKIITYLPKKTIINRNKQLDKDLLSIYFENIKIIESLANSYGFEAFYFWQPNVFTKQYPTEEEKQFMQDTDPSLIYVLSETHSDLHFSSNSLNFFNIDTAFDGINKTVYFDFCHVSEAGNEIIAERISSILIQKIRS